MKNLSSQIPSVIRHANKTITISPKSPKYSLIWLHGLGDSSEGFFEYFMHPKSPAFDGARIRLLQAPLRPVTLNGGFPYNSWYDIKALPDKRFKGGDESLYYDLEEMRQSERTVSAEVDSEVEFWKQQQKESLIYPYHRVYVGGFSQGCATSLYYGLQTPKPIAGIIGFSGYMFQSIKLNNLGKTQILLKHGSADSVVPEVAARESYQKLLGEGTRVSYQCIKNLEHTVTLEQLIQMTKWLKQRHHEYSQYYNSHK